MHENSPNGVAAAAEVLRDLGDGFTQSRSIHTAHIRGPDFAEHSGIMEEEPENEVQYYGLYELRGDEAILPPDKDPSKGYEQGLPLQLRQGRMRKAKACKQALLR